MEKISIPCEWEYHYKVDNFTFYDFNTAMSYEQITENPQVLKLIELVSAKGEIISLNNIDDNSFPAFCYMKIKEDLPFIIYTKALFTYLNQTDTFVSHREYNEILPRTKGIYYNNYSNAFNGSYGFNGFEPIKSLDELEKQKIAIEVEIENTKKIENYFSKTY